MKKILLILLLASDQYAHNRSILRPQEPLPEITTYWLDTPAKRYSLRDSHIEEGPIFKTFNEKFFNNNLLPHEEIPLRNHPEQSVSGIHLSTQIEKFVRELKDRKRHFSDFTVIKDTDFNYSNLSGCIIVKFIAHPFILKLFVENPKSFVRPYSKGFEPCCFFVMGGGIMRHLTGFTRIANIQDIKKLAAEDPYWSKVIDTPRKYFWLPKTERWFVVEGKNIGTKTAQRTVLPSVYGIVADEIKITKKVSLLHAEQALRCMRFCQFTQYRIDPHIQNFRIEKETGKLVLIDTENFRALVGLKDRFAVDSYIDWYMNLIGKCLKDKFFRSKEDRQLAQLVSWEE
jgi:hypothetical protein